LQRDLVAKPQPEGTDKTKRVPIDEVHPVVARLGAVAAGRGAWRDTMVRNRGSHLCILGRGQCHPLALSVYRDDADSSRAKVFHSRSMEQVVSQMMTSFCPPTRPSSCTTVTLLGASA